MDIEVHAEVMDGVPEWEFIRSTLLTGTQEQVSHVVRALRSGPHLPMLYASEAYRLAGKNVFSVGVHQQRQFEDVDLSHMMMSELQMPFDAFYVAMEGGCDVKLAASMPLLPSATTSISHTVRGVYVTKVPQDREIFRSAPPSDELGEGWLFVVWAHHGKSDAWDDVAFSVTLLNRDGSVESALSSIFSRDPNLDSTVTEEDIKGNLRASARVIRMAVGMCAYLQSKDVETQDLEISPSEKARSQEIRNLSKVAAAGGKKGRKAQRRLRTLSKMPAKVTRVGPGMKYVSRESATVATHWRRGHVRMVWVGSRKDEEGNARRGTHREARFIPACLVEGAEKKGDDRTTVYRVK